MSFLIVQNGQFIPHVSSINSPSYGVHHVSPLSEVKKAEEFQSVLNAENFQKEATTKSRRAIETYKESSKKFEEDRRRIYARDIMTFPVISIQGNAPVKEARLLLENHAFRHLPVVNNQSIVGIISEREIILNRDENNKTCQDIMAHKIIVGLEQASIQEIAILLLIEKMNALPIINNRHELTGIITLSDILKFVIKATPFLGDG